MHALRVRILSSQRLKVAMEAIEQEMGKDVADHLRELIFQEEMVGITLDPSWMSMDEEEGE